MTAVQITNHAEDALDSMLAVFGPQLRALVEVCLDEIQHLDDLAWAVYLDSDIDNSIGEQLDQWGRLLIEGRGDLTDDDYRAVLKAKLAALRSDGEAALTIYIANTLVGVAVQYFQVGRASYYLQWERTTASNHPRVFRILELARPAGVDFAAVEAVGTGDEAFQFDDGPGLDQGKLGKLVTP